MGVSFYLFNNNRVNEYTPADSGSPSSTVVATLPGLPIVGAGVSTCAPQ